MTSYVDELRIPLIMWCLYVISQCTKKHWRGELHDAQWSKVSVEGQTQLQGFAWSPYQ